MKDKKDVENRKNVKTCSCDKNKECPLQGKCLTKSVVYCAEVRVKGRKKMNRREENELEILERYERRRGENFKPREAEFYTGLTEGTIKDRMYKHNYDFKHRNFEKRTNLSKYVWKLKDHKYNFEIKWKILSRAKSYNSATKNCNLCTKEKYYIIFKPEASTLNENNEILKKCMHRKKWIIQDN